MMMLKYLAKQFRAAPYLFGGLIINVVVLFIFIISTHCFVGAPPHQNLLNNSLQSSTPAEPPTGVPDSTSVDHVCLSEEKTDDLITPTREE